MVKNLLKICFKRVVPIFQPVTPIEEVTRFTKALLELRCGVERFHKLSRFNFFVGSLFFVNADASATSFMCRFTDWQRDRQCNTRGFFRHSSISVSVTLAIAGGYC